MARTHNTDITGRSFTQTTVNAVWRKGRPINDYDPNDWRYDRCGNPIKFDAYGNTNSKYGWEIDHILPVVRLGSDTLSNLQPLQWKNNRRKGDTYPWSC